MSNLSTGIDSDPLDSIRYAAGTDIGMRREENQDTFGILENPAYRVYLVADGMGGVKGGALASQLAIKTIEEHFTDKGALDHSELSQAIENANTAIFNEGKGDPTLAGMGTTLVGLGFQGT